MPSSLASAFSAISKIPGIDGLSTHACAQLTRACQLLDTQYPNAGSVALGSSLPPSDTGQSEEFAGEFRTLVAQGAKSDADIRQLGLLAIHGLSKSWPSSRADVAKLARDLLWLECNSKLQILSLIAMVLDKSKKISIASALGQFSESGEQPGSTCGERCLAILWEQALKDDSRCLRVALASSRIGLSLSASREQPEMLHVASLLNASAQPLRGRLIAVPRGPVSTAISAFTGWMFARQLATWLFRLALAYRARAQLSITERGLEVHERRTLLGRPLRERTSLISLQAVRRMSREVRFARAGTYAGLATLAIGSFIGMRLFVDGLRAPGFSGPTLLIGLLVVLAGLALDFALTNWLDFSRGQCRLVVETERGRGLCLTCDEPAEVDSILVRLAQSLGR